MSDSFPRQHARTQGFTLGEPRNVTVSPDGRRVVFLRTSAGDDRVGALWVHGVGDGTERLVADPRQLGGGDPSKGTLTAAERARRERARDRTIGITTYATDLACRVAAFSLNGELFTAGLLSATSRHLPVVGPVDDPRPDPTASRLAYVCGSTLRIAELDGSSRVLAGDESTDGVSWGRADFIAAEEMRRQRGYWWSPDGQAVAVCRVDDRAVGEWTIADPADPAAPARTVRYPAAGTDNPVVTLHLIALDGTTVDVDWDREALPYLATVEWTDAGLLLSVQSRDQRRLAVVTVDPASGSTEVVAEERDARWVEIVPGTPRLAADGVLLIASDRDGVRRLHVGGEPITPRDLQVRSVEHVADEIVFLANELDTPTELHAWSTRLDGSEPRRLSARPGVHAIASGGRTTVLRSTALNRPGAVHTIQRDRVEVGVLTSHAETPQITAAVNLLRTRWRDIASAVLLPSGREPDDDAPLPVLLDPYGGPHAQRVTAAHNAFLTSQWFADQGFAVLIADGRGTPGRGAAWERAVHLDLANPPLEDQVEALHDAADRFPALDLSRVAIRGWSFGGYLAALAVLREPDVFHAAIAGAPVTEWRLYDTHYTERYLEDPNSSAGEAIYDENSLLPFAGDLRRPLLIIHGLADDNVVAAHTLQLSSALLAAGRSHEVLPLVGVTHMTPQEVVAENLLRHQLDFLARSLGVDLESSVG